MNAPKGIRFGNCRVKSPRPMALADTDDEEVIVGVWPTTRHDEDCGEYEQADVKEWS